MLYNNVILILIDLSVLQLEAHLKGAHLTIFQGTSYLYKAVPLPSSQGKERSELE